MRQTRSTANKSLTQYIRLGGVIAYPTESCFGLGCDPKNRAAVKRILILKRRPQHKGLILIASNISQLEPYIAPITQSQKAQLESHWPGPHTWLVPAAQHCPRWLTGKHDSIAVRVTAHPVAAALCKTLGMAIVSTSANRSGQQSAKTAKICERIFGERIKVVQDRIGNQRKPSTIQDLASGKILRA